MSKNTNRILVLTLTFITAVVFSGCINSSNVYTEKNFYVLETSRDKQDLKRVSNSTVEVRKFTSPSLKSGKEFVYRFSDGQFKSDYYNAFFVRINKIITDETIKWLEDSGLFGSVISSKNAYGSDLIIEGNIVQLFADFSGKDVKSVIELKFFINETDARKYIPVFHKSYRKEILADSKAPEDLVIAWNKALEQILSDFEDDILLNMGN